MTKKPERKVTLDDPDFGKREPEREKDALLDQKIFGFETVWAMAGTRQVPYRKGWHDFGFPYSVPRYHSEIQEAWLIVEELRKRGVVLTVSSRAPLDPKANNCDEIIEMEKQGLTYSVQWWNRTNQRHEPAVYGRTAAEAICKSVRDREIPKK